MTLALPNSTLHFLDVAIDTEAETVWRAGEEHRLRQKSFQVLVHLLGHRDRVVTREELFETVWPDLAVSEDVLVQCVVEIRKVLGDSSREPRFVRTVPKRGYRFIAQSRPHQSDAVRSTMYVEVETTRSVELEIVEDLTQTSESGNSGARARQRSYFAIAIATAGVMAAVAAAGFWKTRGNHSVALPELRPAGRSSFEGLTTNPDALRFYNLGLERADALRIPEAVHLFERAIAADPGFAMAHARIAYTLGVMNGEVEPARPHLRRSNELAARLSEHDRMIVAGWQAILDGDWDGAIERFRMIIDRYPTDLESHRRLAHLLSGEQRGSEAIAVLERAVMIDPDSPGVYNALGNEYSYVARHQEAIIAHRRYVALRPDEPNAYDSLGLSYNWSGDYDAALEQFARALELKPDFDLARYHRAATYVQLGRFSNAIADLQTCLTHETPGPRVGRAHATMAAVYRLAGDGLRAREAALLIPPGSIWIPMPGEIDEIDWSVDATQRNAATVNNRGARLLRRNDFYLRGYAALKRGERDRAITLLRDSLRLKPMTWNVDSYETGLADAYRELRRYSEAMSEYSRVLTINPNYAAAIYGRARAAEALGRKHEAHDDYQRFLALWKTADKGARARVDAQARLAGLE